MRVAHFVVGVLMAAVAGLAAVCGKLLIAMAMLIVCAFWLYLLPD